MKAKPTILEALLEIRRNPPTRGDRRGCTDIPANMLEPYHASEARAWSHSPLAGGLWESGFRASRAIKIAEEQNKHCTENKSAVSIPRCQSATPAPADPGNLEKSMNMNYEISQILNFENCNAGIPLGLVRDAAVSVIRENWQHDVSLAESIMGGNDMQFDLTAETAAVNEALAAAGCETRADESDVKAGLDRWIEMETIRGNI